MRGERPFVFANIRAGQGVDDIAGFIETRGGLSCASPDGVSRRHVPIRC